METNLFGNARYKLRYLKIAIKLIGHNGPSQPMGCSTMNKIPKSTIIKSENHNYNVIAYWTTSEQNEIFGRIIKCWSMGTNVVLLEVLKLKIQELMISNKFFMSASASKCSRSFRLILIYFRHLLYPGNDKKWTTKKGYADRCWNAQWTSRTDPFNLKSSS